MAHSMSSTSRFLSGQKKNNNRSAYTFGCALFFCGWVRKTGVVCYAKKKGCDTVDKKVYLIESAQLEDINDELDEILDKLDPQEEEDE